MVVEIIRSVTSLRGRKKILSNDNLTISQFSHIMSQDGETT